MTDWFFQVMTLEQAYLLYETMKLTTTVEKGTVIVKEE